MVINNHRQLKQDIEELIKINNAQILSESVTAIENTKQKEEDKELEKLQKIYDEIKNDKAQLKIEYSNLLE